MMPAAQMVGPGPVLTACRARFAGRRLPMAAEVKPEVPAVVELPAQWPGLWDVTNGAYVGPLKAAVMIARGGEVVIDEYGSAHIGPIGCKLITATGKLYTFNSAGSLNKWAEIAASRLIREVELAEAMEPEKRAAWLAVKRAKLEKMARGMVNAAAKLHLAAAEKYALIEEADFAVSKWAHYV